MTKTTTTTTTRTSAPTRLIQRLKVTRTVLASTRVDLAAATTALKAAKSDLARAARTASPIVVSPAAVVALRAAGSVARGAITATVTADLAARFVSLKRFDGQSIKVSIVARDGRDYGNVEPPRDALTALAGARTAHVAAARSVKRAEANVARAITARDAARDALKAARAAA